MEPCFELSKSATGEFRFALKGDHGQALLVSESYRAKDAAQAGIASVQKNCGSDPRYEKKTAADGRFFFNLKASNHQVIGTSRMYASEQDRDAGIEAVKASAATAPVRVVTTPAGTAETQP